jgi:two-component system nitrogen regulation sensor histidine kinase GlnL
MYNATMIINLGLDKNLLDNLSTSIVVVDAQLKIVYVNHSAQAMLEHSINQLLAFPVQQFISESSIDFQRLKDTLSSGDGFSDSEVHMAFNDGRYILADITVTSFELDGQKALLIEVKKIDQQNRISKESQRWAQQQAARDLVRGLAHEIKNPLGGIRGAAQLLEKQLQSPDTVEFTQMIIEQSDRLRTFDDSHDFTVVRDYDPSIPDMWLDQDMIQQAVLNITRNSMQAMSELEGKGQIEIITRIERQMTIHGERFPLVAYIKIIDNGPGIPEDLMDTIFYPMVTGKQHGTGLGLSIAQTLIDHHRGKIDLESWPGHTEFIIYLPIDKKEPVT